MYIHAHDAAASVSTIVLRCLVQSPLVTGPVEGSIKDDKCISNKSIASITLIVHDASLGGCRFVGASDPFPI